jgi:translation initiation factor IF-3
LKGSYRGGRPRPFPRESYETHRINRRISASQVRVVSETGEQLGVLPTAQALQLAEEAGLDLVEVSPQADPPVCKIIDYGKLRYRAQKKAAEARKKRTEIVIKELRIRYTTDVGDLETKLRQAREFLAEGDKVKFSMRFRGREIAHMDQGLERFHMIAEKLKDVAVVDDQSNSPGRQIFVMFTPIKS